MAGVSARTGTCLRADLSSGTSCVSLIGCLFWLLSTLGELDDGKDCAADNDAVGVFGDAGTVVGDSGIDDLVEVGDWGGEVSTSCTDISAVALCVLVTAAIAASSSTPSLSVTSVVDLCFFFLTRVSV